MKAALLAVLFCICASPAFCQDLRPDVTVTNTVQNDPIRQRAENEVLAEAVPKAPVVYPAAEPPPVLGPTKATDLLDVQTIVAKKEAQRAVMKEYNRKMDLAYKSIPNKPSMFWHPMKRSDLWIDYHQDRQRKFRTRDLPNAQMGGTVLGIIFSAIAAAH